MKRALVLGTRGSALALAQVELVKKALAQADPGLTVEVKTISTSGDRRQNGNAWMESGAGLKGMFTKEIEDVLRASEIDVAVHSCKDLPGHLAEGCALRAVLERAPTDDVLVTKTTQTFTQLPVNACLATSSVRRRRQLQFLRGDLVIEEMRGNVPTRLRKLRENSALAGIILARAGLERLGYSIRGRSLASEHGTFSIEFLKTLPAIGQGAIALEARADDEVASAILAKINHAPTWSGIRAERELLRRLDGDCRLPVGVLTTLDQAVLRMQAIIFGEENVAPRTGELEGSADAPEELAERLFQQLYEN